MKTDSYGRGLMDYHKGNTNAIFIVESDMAETEEWPVSAFFHSFDDMSPIERRALSLCCGSTLDVGAGSGSHTLWLQNHNVDVQALDISPLAVDVMQQRGVKNCKCCDFFSLRADEKYDTLLLLMNGIGICGTMDNLDMFLSFCREHISDNGQVLLDSSDLIYLYEDEDGSISLPLGQYYGELSYTMSYYGVKDDPFKWLFVDCASLRDAAQRCGLSCEVVEEGEHFDYLARLRKA